VDEAFAVAAAGHAAELQDLKTQAEVRPPARRS